MPSAPNTDDNGTDQPGNDPSSQPSTAVSSDEASTAPDTGETEGHPGRNATEADQATTDTGESNGEAEGKNEGESFPPRGVLTMRALRWGGLFGAVVFGVTTLVLLLGFPDFGDPTPIMVILTTGPLLVGGTLVRLFLRMMDKKRPVLVTILTTIMAALGMAASAFVTLEWWDTYLKTGFSVLFLLTLAAMNLAITIPLSVTPLLHHLHSTMASASDPDSPSRWRRLHFKTGEKTSKGLPRYERVRVPRRTRRYLTALVIAPALTLGSAIVGTWALVNPVHHVTATSPADGSLTPPASLAPTATWTKEISSTELTTVAGAGGPILLTDEGIMALNPKDGSVLWSYEREHATFVPASSSTPNNRSLITSPDGKYVATRIRQHKFVASPPASDAAITLVFDALTGRIVFEHQGHGGTLQLTDSAVLDGDAAFSLTDGAKMWTLPGGSGASYSGPAGHSSFILTSSEEPSFKNTPTSMYRSTVTTRVFPQNDPTAEVEVPNTLSEIPSESNALDNYFSFFINGWAARYTGETDTSGNPVAEAISLDALAKVDGADTTTFPLGATSGINTEASHLSGSIVTYPVITADAASKRPHENARAATVFAPSTRTVTPASQDRSLAAARTGIVEVPADDGSASAALVIRPGDGSPGTTIPITPGSTYQPFQKLIDKDNAPIQPLFSQHADSERPATAVRTPGAVVVIFNTTGIGYDGCSSGPGNDNQRCRDTYRIFGVTGGQR